jgi:IclR family transcriptional regulator, acetate operon repressor
VLKNQKNTAMKAVSRSAEVLSCIGEGINSTADIAAHCKLSMSSVYRLLKALVEARLLIYNPISRTYYVGDIITKLVSDQQITHDYLISCAREEMQQLAAITEETVNLSLMIGIKYTSLYAIPSKKDLRVVVETGSTDAVNAGAAGKILLSQLDNGDLQIALKNLKLEAFTGYSVVDKKELLGQLRLARQEGYNVCANEKVLGSMGIAAPIRNYVLPAALSVIGPEVRMKPRVKRFTEALLNGAARICENLRENRM